MSTQNQLGPGAKHLLELCHIPLEKVHRESDPCASAEQAADQQLVQTEGNVVQPTEKKRMPPVILAYILALAFMIVAPLTALYYTYDHFMSSKHKTERVEVKEEYNEEEEEEELMETAAAQAEAPAGLSFTIYGQIGGFYDCTMTLENGEGVVDGLNLGQRQVSVFEFDGNDYGGRLVLDAYLNGEYIGQYEGTYYNTSEGIAYSGVFRNSKTGGKVDFDLNSQRSEGDNYEPDSYYEDESDDYYEEYGEAEPWID